MNKVDKYKELLAREHLLREKVIETQSQDVEEERILVTLEREELLFTMSDEEIKSLK